MSKYQKTRNKANALYLFIRNVYGSFLGYYYPAIGMIRRADIIIIYS